MSNEGPYGERYRVTDYHDYRDATDDITWHLASRPSGRWSIGGLLTIAVLVAAVVGFIGLVWAGSADAGVVECPTEDSCEADYRSDGGWVIEADTP